MKILKILGIVIVILFALYLIGFFRSYSVGSGFGAMPLEPGTQIERKSCIGKSITTYDARPVDGGAKFFCVGFVKTTVY